MTKNLEAFVRNDFRPSLPVDEVRKRGIRGLVHGDPPLKMFLRGRGGRKMIIYNIITVPQYGSNEKQRKND